ncbi:MAG: DNA polymerase III subunit gamma/tau [Clostridiales bacterium]|nr:DNA polymerase III subunit gamma/tau [Clostridiales bacterium]
MAYLALYRRYRPTTFSGLIGQEHITKTLVNQINGDKLGHAYLFTGTRGTGKTSCAKIFAKAINCLNPVNGSPCGECEVCKALSDPSNIDVVEIDAASNNGVNEIRDLREKVQYPPVSCKYKVYIVDEVHMLTGPAFNALLKTLEEPPKHAVFILATTEVHKIPATILSRCMRFDFRLIDTERIAKLISEIYDEQGKAYDSEAVFAIAKAGEGSIRDALSVADIAISYNNEKLTYDDVMDILGSSNAQTLIEFVNDVIQSQPGKVLSTIDKLSSSGKSVGVLIKDVTALLRDLIVIKNCENANQILRLPKNRFSIYENIANSTSEERLLRILEIFTDAESSLKYSNHPRVIFETASVKSARPDSDYNIDALMSRIKKLEEQLEKGVKVVEVQKNQEIKIVEEEKEETSVAVQQPQSKTENVLPKQEVEHKVNPSIDKVAVEEIKGKLLFNLRKNGSEMLWNIVQSINIEVVGKVLVLIADKASDQELLDKAPSRMRIEEALEEFLPFELQIKLSDTERTLDAVDKATERVKKIFGDDIVIIK